MNSSWNPQLKRVFWSIFLTICTSIVVAMIQYILGELSSYTRSPFGAAWRIGHLTSHESQIYATMIDADRIVERMGSIGGLSEIKEDLKTNVMIPLRYPHLFFSEHGELQPCRGVLLHGPPGTGKTMLARALAAEAGVPFLSLGLSNLENKYFGETSKLLAACFSVARKIQPCILFFDEIDGLVRVRNDSDHSCVYGMKTEMMTHMDGMGNHHSDAFFVIGCTNSLGRLDPALKRRLPKRYEIKYPTRAEFVDIATIRTKGVIPTEQLQALSRSVVPTCTGSDIAEAVRTAHGIRIREACAKDDFMHVLDRAKTSQDVLCSMKPFGVKYLVTALGQLGLLVQQDEDIASTTESEDSPPSTDDTPCVVEASAQRRQ